MVHRRLLFLFHVLAVAGFANTSFCEDSSIRFEYRGENVPLHLKFSSVVSLYTHVPDDDPDNRVDIIHGQLNLLQNSSGAWYMPKPESRIFDYSYAQQMLDLLLALKLEVEFRSRRVIEVVACSPNRARPHGVDIYVALEVINDATLGIWEELRQRVAPGPFGEGISKLMQHSGSISSITHHYRILYERSGIDPEHMLDVICTNMLLED